MAHSIIESWRAKWHQRASGLADKFNIEDTKRLAQVLADARHAYNDRGRLDGGDIQKTRHQLAAVADHLSEALRLLDDDFVQLEVKAQQLGPEPTDSEIEAGIGRFDERLCAVEELRDLCRAASEGASATRGRGRPPSSRDLQRLVAVLAAYWRDELGRRFSAGFENVGNRVEPMSPAALFVTHAARACGVEADPGKIRHAMRPYVKSPD